MNRFPIPALMLLIASCAHITEPVSQATNLVALISGESETPDVHDGCPEWIKLEGAIGDPEDFVKEMAACRDRSVVVEINSPGGSIFGALEIQKAIERHPHPVICVVDGMAASAAFITLQSCDLRAMTDRSVLMAHHAAARAGGQSQDLKNLADALRELDRAQALHCAKRMQMSPDAYAARTSGGQEWWMGIEAAQANHAIDFEVKNVAEALEIAKAK